MFTARDYQRIQTEKYQLNEEELSSILDSLQDLSFPNSVTQIFENVLCGYSQVFPPSFAFEPELQKDTINELLLQLLNFLSVKTSDRFSSLKDFIVDIPPIERTKDSKNTKNTPKTISLTYQTPKSFQNAIDNLIFYKSKVLRNITVGAPGADDTYALIDRITNESLLECTPLFDFLLDFTEYMELNQNKQDSPNWFRSPVEPTESEIRNLTKNETERLPIQFRHEGKYFMAVLLRTLKSKGLPYTKSSRDGISRQALNSLLETLYYAYQRTEQIYTDTLERLLFLINAEDIFHVSLAREIFTDYNMLLTKYGNSAKLGFKYSFRLLYAIRACPLSSLGVSLWKTYNKFFFEEGATNNKKYHEKHYEKYDFVEKISDLIKDLTMDEPTLLARNFQEMIDCIFYLILESNGCFPAEDSTHNMSQLKKSILCYLSQSTKPLLSWSCLEMKRNNLNDPDLYIPSTFSHYFNFLLLYALFLPFNEPFESFMRDVNIDYASDWYITFLLNHKKEK